MRNLGLPIALSLFATVGWGASALDAPVREAAREFDGELSLFVLDVSTGESYAQDADRPTYLSSAVKITVMLEVLRQVDAGLLSYEEKLELGADDVRDGMLRLAGTPVGTRFTIAELLEFMMVYSDNAAADLLLARVGLGNVRAGVAARGVTIRTIVPQLEARRRVYSKLDPRGAELSPQQIQKLGQHGSPAGRGRALAQVLGRPEPWNGRDVDGAFLAYYRDEVNSASMRQMGTLLAQIARCEGLSPTSCSRAHALMAACQTGANRVAAGLPDGARWLHKTGTQHRRACDLGILHLQEDRPIVVAACTRDFWRVEDAERLLARVGEIVSEALDRVDGIPSAASWNTAQ